VLLALLGALGVVVVAGVVLELAGATASAESLNLGAALLVLVGALAGVAQPRAPFRRTDSPGPVA